MHITFSPMRRDDILTLERWGDILIVNGEEFDFTALPEDGELPVEAIDSVWFAGPVYRTGQTLHITLLLPHGADAPSTTQFPAPLVLSGDGPVPVPVHTCTEKESADDEN